MKHKINITLFYPFLILFAIYFYGLNAKAQDTEDSNVSPRKEKRIKINKGKQVKYNCFGAAFDLTGNVPWNNKMVGGNHVYYRRFGYGISWRLGIKNYEEAKDPIGEILYENAAAQNLFTGKFHNTYSYSANFTFVTHITKKIPFYIGLGLTRQKQKVEIFKPWNPAEKEWIINPDEVKFLPNFTAGFMIPLYRRLIFNMGYDHMPQCVFVGLTICGPYNFEDIDMW